MCALQCVCCGHQVKRQEEQTYAPIIALISLQPRGETFRRLCMFLCAAPDVVFRLNLKMSASFLKSRNKQAMAPKIVIEDDKIGWCEGFVKACEVWEQGKDVEIDYSLIRPAGAKLGTMGGRASGPGVLQDLMKFTKRKILARQGRRLTTLDLHDVICEIGLIVDAGGMRRSALISLSAFDDHDMRDAKKGNFWQTEGQHSMANNSAVYEVKPSAEEFLQEWTALVTSHAG